MAYESTNALANLANLKRQKKMDRWSMIKDVAGMGMGLWEKLSRVPEAKELASFTSGLEEERAVTEDQRTLSNSQQMALLDEEIDRRRRMGQQTDALELERMRLANAKSVATIYAGTNAENRQQQIRTDVDEYVVERLSAIRPDLFILDENGDMTLDFSKKDAIKTMIMKKFNYIRDTQTLSELNEYVDAMLNSGVMPAKTADGAIGKSLGFNPPSEQPPPKPSVTAQQVNSIARKIGDALKTLQADPSATNDLKYMLQQLPRAGNPKGGFDYSADPVLWMKMANEAINKMLGIIGSQSREAKQMLKE